MIENKKVLALIPARGGSKRLPRKNVLDLAGKPLIAWTIEAAKKSKYIDRVVVSTDDEEIAAISKTFGADVPFMRPYSLASDTATSNDVILHAINELDEPYDLIIILQPTSPLRNHTHIDESLELLLEKQGEGVVSVTPCEHSPLWSNTLPEDGNMDGFFDKLFHKRSQDLPCYYRLNGAIYCFTIESLMANKGISYNDRVYSYLLPIEYSVDIDTKFDFEFANYCKLI